MLQALIHFGHLLGVVLIGGGLFYFAFVIYPASAKVGEGDRGKFMNTARWRGKLAVHLGILLLLATGVMKMIPGEPFGGVGFTGRGSFYAAFLHSKIVLAFITLYFAFQVVRKPRDEVTAARRPMKVRFAALLAILVVFLASMHAKATF